MVFRSVGFPARSRALPWRDAPTDPPDRSTVRLKPRTIMRKLVLALLLLPMAACSSLSSEQESRGIRSVASLSNEYESGVFWHRLRQRSDGRNNAWGRDLMKINDFFDRHFWNYDVNDPTVNYPSDTTKLDHLGRFGMSVLTSVPGVDEITTRL